MMQWLHCQLLILGVHLLHIWSVICCASCGEGLYSKCSAPDLHVHVTVPNCLMYLTLYCYRYYISQVTALSVD